MNTIASARPIRNWHRAHQESLTRGQRAADTLRNVMGSWAFVGGFVAFMAVWAAVNSLTGTAWDPYPFILLNLFLSMLAGLQGAILLIAAKRQDGIAAALAQHDYDTDKAARADIESLLTISRRQVVALAELQEILKRLDIPALSELDASGSGATGAADAVTATTTAD